MPWSVDDVEEDIEIGNIGHVGSLKEYGFQWETNQKAEAIDSRPVISIRHKLIMVRNEANDIICSIISQFYLQKMKLKYAVVPFQDP